MSTILQMIGSSGRSLHISFDGQREGKSEHVDFLWSVKVAVWAVVLAVRYEVQLLDEFETACFIEGLSGWLTIDKGSGVERIESRSRVPDSEGAVE